MEGQRGYTSRGVLSICACQSAPRPAARAFLGRQSRRCFHHPKPAGQCAGSSCSARCDCARDLRAASRKKSGDHPAGSMELRAHEYWCLMMGTQCRHSTCSSLPPTTPWTGREPPAGISGILRWSSSASFLLQTPRAFLGRQSRRCFHHPKPAGQCARQFMFSSL